MKGKKCVPLGSYDQHIKRVSDRCAKQIDVFGIPFGATMCDFLQYLYSE